MATISTFGHHVSSPRTKFANCISWLEIIPASYSNGVRFTANLKRFTSLNALTLRLVDISYISHESEVLENIEKLEVIGCTNHAKDYRKLLNACKMLKHLTVRFPEGTSNALFDSINEHVHVKNVSWLLDMDYEELADDLRDLRKLKHLKRLIIFFMHYAYAPRVGKAFAIIDKMKLEKLESI